MQRAKTARWEEKREDILAAAARVLNRIGLSGLRLADVAAEIGLKRPSIVYYFANTEELAEELYHRALDQIDERVSIAAKEAGPRERLGKLLELELDDLSAQRSGNAGRRPQLGEVRALSSARRRALGRRYHQILTRVSEMLGVDSGQARLIERLGPAHILMETIFWLPAWLDEYEPWAFPSVQAVLVETLLVGLAAARPVSAARKITEEPRIERNAIDHDDYLQTATRLICGMGIRGAAIDRITSELGVTKGSFYHHINQKNELIEACFSHSQKRLSAIQKRATEREPAPEVRVESVILTVIAIQFEGRFPLLRTSALPALDADARGKIIAQSKRNSRWFASEIAAGVAAGTMQSRDPHVSAQIVGVAINAVYDLPRLYGEGIKAADGETYAALLMHGILTAPH